MAVLGAVGLFGVKTGEAPCETWFPPQREGLIVVTSCLLALIRRFR